MAANATKHKPHSNFLSRFKGIHHRQQNLFATLGYSVVVADCPGSANRGKVWAEAIYQKMGTVEVNMQVRG